METTGNKYNSRKFFIALFAILSADVLVVIGSITASVFAAIVGTAIVAYITGNVAQKAVLE